MTVATLEAKDHTKKDADKHPKLYTIVQLPCSASYDA